MNLPYASVQDAVQAIKTLRFSDLKSLPYNRFDAQQSGWWWLLKSSDRAGFHLPKLTLCEPRVAELEGKVHCGLHIEKGVQPDASENPHHHMDADWFWHRLSHRVRGTLLAVGASHPVRTRIWPAYGVAGDFAIAILRHMVSSRIISFKSPKPKKPAREYGKELAAVIRRRPEGHKECLLANTHFGIARRDRRYAVRVGKKATHCF